MQTKEVMPWNLKVGQKLVQCAGFNQPQRGFEILEIEKGVGYFTGDSIWRVKTNNPFWDSSTFHGKSRNYPPQKAKIMI